MGIKGPLPTLKLMSEPLADHNPPSWLSSDAQSFWRKHVKQLAENQLLTEQTADSFACLCDLWGRVQEMNGMETNRTFLDTHKAFISLAKVFRLAPTEKPNVKVDRFADLPEIPL